MIYASVFWCCLKASVRHLWWGGWGEGLLICSWQAEVYNFPQLLLPPSTFRTNLECARIIAGPILQIVKLKCPSSSKIMTSLFPSPKYLSSYCKLSLLDQNHYNLVTVNCLYLTLSISSYAKMGTICHHCCISVVQQCIFSCG